jgi:catechol 2,3-dioxygenase-like lactoylglutathione lyase family enzyme
VASGSAFSNFLKSRGPGVFALAYPASTPAALQAEKARLAALAVGVLEEGVLELEAGRRVPYVFFDTAPRGKIVLGLIHDQAPDAASSLAGPAVTQLALTARNLDAVSAFWAKLGFPAFSFTHPDLTARVYRGKPADFAMRLGWQLHLNVAFEWIEPLKGPNVYEDHIAKHGEGFHHIAFNVTDMDEAIARWTALGGPVSMSGGWGVKNTHGSGRFAYHDLHAAGGIEIELLWNYRPPATLPAAQPPARFAPDRMETIFYGAAYYPEYMPRERLEQDVELMRKADITLVRVGESTWSSWEPRDGHFELDWMQRVLDRLQRAGIKVILGTPTYSIPTWLHRKHPDLVVTHNGVAPPLSNQQSASCRAFLIMSP